ncbi:MAG: hypothetical protein KC519_12420, partial [Anaerolineae bacterium]|nr:hypothetical protein [Anaerolineae bacterium]
MISHRARPRFMIVLIAALMLGILVSGTAFATSNASFTTFIPPLDYGFAATPDTDDGGGVDYIMLACYNAAGEVLDTDNLYAPATSTPATGTFYCDPYSMDGTPPADLTPAIWKMFDITSNVPENQLAQMGLIESSALLSCAGACTSATTTTT